MKVMKFIYQGIAMGTLLMLLAPTNVSANEVVEEITEDQTVEVNTLVTADNTAHTNTSSTELPATTTITIHHLQGTTVDNTVLNTNGEIVSAEELSKLGENIRPLPGVSFTVFGKNEKQLTSGNTDENGQVQFKIAAENYGEIRIEQTSHTEGIVSEAIDTTLILPFTNSVGNGYNANINIYPKQVTSEPEFTAPVFEDGQAIKSITVGDSVGWSTTAKLPNNLSSYGELSFTFNKVDGLDFDSKGFEIIYTDGTKIAATDSYKVEDNGDSFTIKLSDQFLNNPNNRSKEIRIKAKAIVNREAMSKSEYITSNIVTNFNNKGGDNSSRRVVDLGSVTIRNGGQKFTVTKDKQTSSAQATFKLYKQTTRQPVVANDLLINVNNPYFTKDGEEIIVSTDDGGKFSVEALADGEYYLQQMTGPAGYVLTSNQHNFSITEETLNGEAINIDLNKNPQLPQTGGIGTFVFTIVGLTLVAVAMFGLRKERQS